MNYPIYYVMCYINKTPYMLDMAVSAIVTQYFPVKLYAEDKIPKMSLEYLQDSGFALYVPLKDCPGHV